MPSSAPVIAVGRDLLTPPTCYRGGFGHAHTPGRYLIGGNTLVTRIDGLGEYRNNNCVEEKREWRLSDRPFRGRRQSVGRAGFPGPKCWRRTRGSVPLWLARVMPAVAAASDTKNSSSVGCP